MNAAWRAGTDGVAQKRMIEYAHYCAVRERFRIPVNWPQTSHDFPHGLSVEEECHERTDCRFDPQCWNER